MQYLCQLKLEPSHEKKNLDVSDLWLFRYIWEPPNVAEDMGFCLELPQGPYYPSANSKSSGDNIISD